MITITHTRADGTLIEGSRKGDGIYEVLKGLHDNWRWFPSIQRIGIGQSRDRAALTWKIERAADALRAAGHEVTVEIDETVTRPFAEAEAERYERAGARAEYHDGKAAARRADADGHWQAERAILDHIPPGQPILIGHHSEGRHRRDLARADGHMRRGIEALSTAEYHDGRADAAQRYQAHRESVPTTLRRIEKLEAESRLIQRRLDGTDPYHAYGTPASGGYRERLTARQAEITEQLAYWRQHVASREADGVKVWSRADFTTGDYVLFLGTWYEVLRVNAKSVTIPAMINTGPVVHATGNRCTWTDTVAYHKITARKSADEIAAMLAATGEAAR